MIRAVFKALLALPGGRQVFDVYLTAKRTRWVDLEDRWRRLRLPRAARKPLPGLFRMTSVAGTPSIEWFERSGAAALDCLRAALGSQGRSLEACRSVLDFGCGCGRVLRHFEGLAIPDLHGVDINASSIRWARRHLPFATFAHSPLAPPLPLAAGRFELIYALSVFTHLPDELQHAWLAELHRLLAPGGLLFFTSHGDSYRGDLDDEQRARYDAGRLVVRRGDIAGSNLCGAYHPPAWVEAHLAPSFRLLAHVPEGALGNPHQDYYLAERR